MVRIRRALDINSKGEETNGEHFNATASHGGQSGCPTVGTQSREEPSKGKGPQRGGVRTPVDRLGEERARHPSATAGQKSLEKKTTELTSGWGLLQGTCTVVYGSMRRAGRELWGVVKLGGTGQHKQGLALAEA